MTKVSLFLLLSITCSSALAAPNLSQILARTRQNGLSLEGHGIMQTKTKSQTLTWSLSIHSSPTKLLYCASNATALYQLNIPDPTNSPTQPFAESEFWNGDLSLDFLNWKSQVLLPNPTKLKRGRAYFLLQSTGDSTTMYSKVLTWLDQETNGIIAAETYDQSGKLLKTFEPKSFQKIEGQWQVKQVEMRNVQSHAYTTITLAPATKP
jgi:hypothetical protein